MEELQDAIEDAQYVNATLEEGPRPVVAWKKPTEEQLDEWESSVRRQKEDEATRGEPFSLNWTLSSAIGFFLFSSFLKETHDDYTRINFVEDVIRWKRIRGRKRLDEARRIAKLYLSPPETDTETGELQMPKKTEIHEYDLLRLLPTERLKEDEVADLYMQCKDTSKTKSAVGLQGSVVEEILGKIAEMEAKKMYDDGASHDGKEGPERSEPFVQDEASLRSLTARFKSRKIESTAFDRVEALVVESIRQDYWEDYLESEHYIKMKNFLWYQDKKITPDDFVPMRVLGRGGFGLVHACKKSTSGKLYAMKVMDKKRIKMKKSEQLAINERSAMAAVDSPFVVSLKYSFHTKEEVFLVLDLMTGGDLAYHLHQRRRFDKTQCLYYAARIMLGLQAMHDKGYVYRDLKPENCLLGEDGRVKLTDLGLATKITPTLHGAAGTRGYWAPEMLRRDKRGKRMPYGHTVDWFSFGCCLAEFISGSNPFRSEAAWKFGQDRGKEPKEKAIDCATLEMDPEFNPPDFEPDAADLCRKLLDKNEKTRLGANGCEQIMAHRWFRKVDWEKIMRDQGKPPFVPPKDVNAASQSEIGNFAEDKEYQETVITAKDEEVYKNWDWTNPRAFSAEVLEYWIYERVTGEPIIPMSQQSACCCIIS